MNLKHTHEWRNEEVIISEYDVLLPEDYEECTRNWPLVVCMVGGGGHEDVKSRINSLMKKDAVILYPTIHPKPDYVLKSRHYWNFRILNEIVRKVIAEFGIDKGNVSVTGFSMGGTAAWEFPYYQPDLFCRVGVISGSVQGWKLKHYPDIPVHVYSGGDEEFLKAHTFSVELAKDFGNDIVHTIWPGLGHGECFLKTIRDDNFLELLVTGKEA
jgi:predicted peptidase